MFGSLLERPLVATDAVDRYPLLVSMFDKELDCCKRLYNKHIQTAEELGESHNDACILHSTQFSHLTERCVSAGCKFMDPTRLLRLGMKMNVKN